MTTNTIVCVDPVILPGGGGGGGGGGGFLVQLPENSSGNFFLIFFLSQLILQFYRGLSMVYFNFQRIQRGPTFSKGGLSFSRGGVQLFPGRGLNANLYRNP